MLKRARRRLKGPGRWAVDEDSEGAEGADTAVPKHPSVAVDLVMFKIKCGKCSATLKIPAGVDVFRCPKCASKLRVPNAQANGQAAPAGSIKSNANKAMKELSDVARSTRDVITRHKTERRREATREALSESQGGADPARGVFKVAGGCHRRDVQAGEREDGGGGWCVDVGVGSGGGFSRGICEDEF